MVFVNKLTKLFFRVPLDFTHERCFLLVSISDFLNLFMLCISFFCVDVAALKAKGVMPLPNC